MTIIYQLYMKNHTINNKSDDTNKPDNTNMSTDSNGTNGSNVSILDSILAATGSALKSAVFGGKQNVYYLGSDNHVYELAYDGTKWVSVDLTTAGKGKLAAAGSALTTVVIPHGTSVFYLGSNNHVYELGHRSTSASIPN
jgi:hypothetical protein